MYFCILMIDLFIMQGGIIGSMTGNCRFYSVSGTFSLETLVCCHFTILLHNAW